MAVQRTLPLMAIVSCLAGILLVGGCSGEELVEQGKDSLWTLLYIVIGIVSLGIVIWAWSVHRALGIAVLVLAVGGLGVWHYLTYNTYVEPPEDQPHARIAFLSNSQAGTFSVCIDSEDIGFAAKAKPFHPGFFFGTREGEYTVRVSPGDHEIGVGYSLNAGTYTEETKKDLKLPIQVLAREQRYILLSSPPMYVGGPVSVEEITEASYNRQRSYLEQPPDKRRPPPLPEHLARAMAKVFAEKEAAAKGLSAAQKEILIERVTKRLMQDPSADEPLEVDEMLRLLSEQK
jgi:hypothetical protein